MFDPSALIGLLKTHGLSLLAPLSVIEGPIVTVLAGWLSSVIGAQIWQIALVVIAGDLLGDVIFYAAGRAGPHALPGDAGKHQQLDQQQHRDDGPFQRTGTQRQTHYRSSPFRSRT